MGLGVGLAAGFSVALGAGLGLEIWDPGPTGPTPPPQASPIHSSAKLYSGGPSIPFPLEHDFAISRDPQPLGLPEPGDLDLHLHGLSQARDSQ